MAKFVKRSDALGKKIMEPTTSYVKIEANGEPRVYTDSSDSRFMMTKSKSSRIKCYEKKYGEKKPQNNGMIFHSVVGPAFIQTCQESGKIFREEYYLFGKQFKKEDWENHDLVILKKLSLISNPA